MYLEGRGVAHDGAEAVRLFRQAADQGLSEAQFCLGRMLEREDGVNQHVEMAMDLYRQAAEQGYAPAQQAILVRSKLARQTAL